MIRKFKAPVTNIRRLEAPGHYVVSFSAPELAVDSRPGHFIAISGEMGAQILRRPFSIFTADAASGVVSILFSVYGPVTKMMSAFKPGDVIDLVGPLGGHLFAPDSRPNVHHIMVGGGYGVPPLAFLSRIILSDEPAAKVTFINGARRRDFLVGTDGLREIGVAVRTCTNDGSCGTSGLVTDILSQILTDRDHHAPVHIYTCGPTPMMKAVSELSVAQNVPCQVSMEVFMPCGIGICMGCSVELADGTFARGCKDGPVFEAREVVWQ